MTHRTTPSSNRPPGGAERTGAARRRLALGAAIVTAALAAPLLVLIPPGEAPDEPAHLAYADHLLRERVLPPVTEHGPAGYESYQPPLAYAAMAGAAALAGHREIEYPFERDPEFTFGPEVRRMHVAPERSPEAERALASVRAARAANLLWGALASAATAALCLRLASSVWIALAAAAPFCLAPQLLFASATANNDAALAALAALALCSLAHALSSPAATRPAAAASMAAGLAFGAKVSAAVLAPAIVLGGGVLSLLRRRRAAAALILPGLVLTVGWILLNLARTGAAVPRVPTGWGSAHAGTVSQLLTEPWWIVQVWVGFWAKLGWFNVPLPLPAYLLFVPASCLAATGVATLLGRERSRLAGLLASVVIANLALLIIYLVTVDWQPQGRYLLPSLPSLAGLAATGLEWMASRFAGARRHLPALAGTLVVLAVVAVVLTIRQAAIVY